MEAIYRDKALMYSVMKDETDNSYYIQVLCGGVGMYKINVKLSNDEVKEFKENNQSLNDLAREIAMSPDKFKNRQI